MKTFYLAFFVPVAVFSTSCSEYHDGDLKKLSEALKTLAFRELYSKFEKNTNNPQAVAPLPILCILAQLSQHGCNDNLMKLFNVKTELELKRILSVASYTIDGYKTRTTMDYAVFTDNHHPLSRSFSTDFATMCGGVTNNIDFENSSIAAHYVNQWFQKISNASSGRAATEDLFKTIGLVYTSSYNFVGSLNHRNNPTGIGALDFHFANHTIIKTYGFFGNAFVHYAENRELDSKILRIQFLNDEYYAIVICPNNPNELSRVVEILQDVDYFNKVVSKLKPMCVNLKFIFGAAHTANTIRTNDLNHSGIRMKGYSNVYENSTCKAVVNGIIQEVHLTADPIQETANPNSPRCLTGHFPEVTINSPLLYHLMYPFGGPAVSGVFMGDF